MHEHKLFCYPNIVSIYDIIPLTSFYSGFETNDPELAATLMCYQTHIYYRSNKTAMKY